VLNAGIGGNRILREGVIAFFGPSGVSRLAVDAIAQAGVTDVMILEGINDIGQMPYASATDVIDGLQQLVDELHIARLNVLLGTLTPTGGSIYGSAAVNDTRQAVNTWIRSSGVADGVVDFDGAVRDPQDPSRINPLYDGSDHVHFNPAGYEAMADAVNLAELQGPP
jgi:lysophospholipase L1-like esterase